MVSVEPRGDGKLWRLLANGPKEFQVTGGIITFFDAQGTKINFTSILYNMHYIIFITH